MSSDQGEAEASRILRVMRRVSLVISLLLFAISLALPIAVGPALGNDSYQGILALVMGWVCLYGGATAPFWSGLSWLANPAYLLALVSYRHATAQRRWALAALILASLFLTIQKISENEGGRMTEVSSVGPGYWVWLASMIVLNVHARCQRPSDGSTATDPAVEG